MFILINIQKSKLNLDHDFPYLSNKNNNYYYSQEFLEKYSSN